MDAKTLTTPAIFCTFLVAPSEEPISAPSRDYGFDFDEEKLAREMLAPLPIASAAPTTPEVEANEFEKAFHYFIS